MTKDLRQLNKRRVLDVLLAHFDKGATQPEIEAATHLSRASVKSILQDLQPVLLKNGAEPLAASRGGRRAKLFHLRDDIGAIGIDFGRSHVRVGVQRMNGSQPGKANVLKTDRPGFTIGKEPDAALDLAAKLIDSLLNRSGSPTSIAGICIGLAAPVDYRGRVRTGPFPAWADLDLRAELFERLGDHVRASNETTRVLINNDANLGLKAELLWGAARGAKDAIYVKWSSGLGAALCVDGRILRGSGGVAGEIGHTAVWDTETDGECDWCQHHCLELATSLEPKGLSMTEIKEIAGDPAHRRHKKLEDSIRESAALIGRTLAPVVNGINPQVVVVGGHCPELFPQAAVPPLRSALEASVFPSIGRDVRVRASSQPLGSEVVGALAAVFEELFPEYLIEIAEAESFVGS